MLFHPRTSHGPDDNEIYLILDRTVPGSPEIPRVQPPASEKRHYAEVLADFNRRKNAFAALEPEFHIAKPFRLVTREQFADFQKGRGSAITGSPLKATDLFRLTDVYFDSNRTLALTAISHGAAAYAACFNGESLPGRAAENGKK